jgi:type I restriction-modification system DNA methylase subunit
MTNSAANTVQPRQFQSFNEITGFIWSIANLLRGDYKQPDYGKVIPPFIILRRLDCVLDATRQRVLARHESLQSSQVKSLDPILNRITGVPFHNISKLTFDRLKDDPGNIAANVTSYINGFSATPERFLSSALHFTSTFRNSTRPTCSTRWCAVSPRWTCTPGLCPTASWARSSKS